MPPEASGEADDEPIYEQAALWVARLFSPDATDADRRAFETWRSADPAHAEAYAEMEEWRRTLGHAPDPRRAKRRTPGGPAVLAALGLLGAILAQGGPVDRLRADAWTGVGAIEATTLADGSRVDLNTDTAIALRFTPDERGIELLRGEAVFDVAPDPGRPFVVRGRGVTATALGTRFFVRVDGAGDPVGVVEGRVEAATAAGSVRIDAGEVARRGPDDRLSVGRGDVARAIAWREGRLVYAGRPLAEVLADLQRYRLGRIVLLGEGVGARRFTGRLDARDTDDALDVLAAAMGLTVTRVTPLLALVRPLS